MKSPFILASAPPTGTGDMIGRAFEAGWAGAVTKTLVTNADAITNVTPRLYSLGFPGRAKKLYAFENIELVTDRSFTIWLKEIGQLRKKYPDRLIIASIMDDASKPDGWAYMAPRLEEAGAHMLEINMSCPHGMPERGMGMAIGQDPELAALVTRWTVESCKIPVIAKMTPNVTDVGLVAQRCVEAGAHSISAINTVASISGVNLETLVPEPSVGGYSTFGGLSGLAIKPIALKAVATVAQTVQAPISGIGGVDTWEDAAEFLLLGASNVQICTAVMVRGLRIINKLSRGLGEYMARKGFKSAQSMIGRSLDKLIDLDGLSRDEPLVSRISKKLCIRCGRCFTSCMDAGHQAIRLQKDKTPVVIKKKCTGCSLCLHVCPVEGCVALTKAP